MVPRGAPDGLARGVVDLGSACSQGNAGRATRGTAQAVTGMSRARMSHVRGKIASVAIKILTIINQMVL